jgi:glycosyltransferase involved in cell wall biosynthesis
MRLMREWKRRLAVWAGATFRLLPTDIRQHVAPTLRRLYHRQVAASMPQAAAFDSIDRSLPFGVGVFGYLTAESGVGEGARSSAVSLQAAGVPLSPINVELRVYANSETSFAVSESRENPFGINLVHLNADQMAALPELIGSNNFARRYTIGYWAWELAEFPDAFVPAFEAVHEVWVPSRFVAEALEKKTNKPVRVMPHRIDTTPPPRISRQKFGLPADKVLFLASVDFNSYIERKNVFGAITAFRRAFAHSDAPAHLVIKAHGGANAFRTQRAQLMELVGNDPRITVIDRILPRAEVTELQAAIDVFVSLHRAEGFGLPIAECMGLGKLVIATDYSGSTGFVAADCAMPVPYHLVPVDDRTYPLGNGRSWADPDLDAAAQMMLRAAEDPALRTRLGQAAAAKIASQFNAATIGAQMAARLAEIRAQLAAG